MERHIRIRNRIIGQIEATLVFAKGIDDNISENAIRPRLADLIKRYDDFHETEIALEEFDGYESVTEKIDSEYYQARALLEDALFKHTGVNVTETKGGGELNETLETFVTQQRTFYEALNTTTAVKLPKVNVEPFNGDYRMWPSFRDLYTNSIHNHPNMKGSQKLQQLKSLVRGEAAGLIRHITTTDQNYIEAWEKLEARYNKPKPIVSALIQSFLDQKSCKIANYKELRRLYDHSDEVVRALRSIGKKEESRDPWLIHLLLQKVDNETRQLWARDSVDNLNPTFSEFLSFLNIRCDTLESCNIQDKRVVYPQAVKSFLIEQPVQVSSKFTCLSCKGDHLLHRCPSFRNNTLEARIALVNEQRLCHNCLRKGHYTLRCLSKTSCLICRKRHHSLLHPQSTEHQNLSSTAHSLFIEQPHMSAIQNQLSTSNLQTTHNHLPISNHQATHNHPATQDHQTTANHQSTLNQQSTSCVPLAPKQMNQEQTASAHNYISLRNNSYITQSSTCILLPTALVNVKDRNGELVEARILLDSGSQCAFVTETLVKRLGLSRSKSNIQIIGLASSSVGCTKGRATLTMQSRYNPNNTINITSQIIKTISSNLPENTFDLQSHNQLKEIQLADPTFNQARPVDILIGAEHFFDIVGNEKMYIPGLPHLHQSHFGWLVAGSMESNVNVDCRNILMVKSMQVIHEDLNELLKRFWEVEEPPVQHKLIENYDHNEHFYSTTTVKTKTNQFEVRLPFLSPRLTIGKSYMNAKCRLLAMERKFKTNKEFHMQYKQFMEEYEQLHHMQRVEWAQIPNDDDKRYFMPHHGVYKESSSTTKLRVVFDASCKTSNSVSLNDVLHVGPKIQTDLFNILLRFRTHQIVFVADIEKMYRQIMVNDNDCNYQLILWRDDPTKEINVYKLRTVTYGVNCSPFLAIRTLHQIALENSIDHPNASHTILNDFYIDDLLSGADTVEAALKLKDEVVSLLTKHGLHLRKWRSNSQKLLNSVSQSEFTSDDKLLEEDQAAATLGIKWNAITDTFSFQTKLFEISEWTKRKILSEISKIYDPFGWLTPTIILFKFMIQRLWVAQLDWDTPVPVNLNDEFQSIYKGLTSLNHIKIQRCYHKFEPSKLKNVEIHAFCDASEMAYGSVLYLRAIGIDGSITTQIICAKSKVSPIKQICLPRLELCGAYILAKLVKLIKEVMFTDASIEVFAWCDSSIVLHWLADIPRRWKTFIANRTSYILDIIPSQQWRYVRSKQNPADLLTRGVHPERLYQAQLWWNGPTWLKQPSSDWPCYSYLMKPLNSTFLEAKTSTLHCTSSSTEESVIDKLFASCSSYMKVKNTVVYILRFGRRSTGTKAIIRGAIQIKEINYAEKIIFRTIQEQHFSTEISSLRKNQEISSKSRLKTLSIFLDKDSILRIGGRLKNSDLKYSSQHPVILPRGHPLNKLIIKEIHRALLHGGLSLTLNTLRSKFWMIDARNTIKSYIKNCTTCIKFRAITAHPKMGDLPAERVTQHRPFLNSGLDYAGPIYIRTSKLRKAPISKAYIAVFVCLAVKAVHLELVSSLDTESFIAALRRFVARRGLPAIIRCDNGSNFVSGNSELKTLHKQLIQQQNSNIVYNFCLQRNIQFIFNPPSGPHFGGLWEATVKSVKFHLRRVTNNSNFTFEELGTLTSQIEAILNSRPLCRLHDDIDELQALTPGHFLIGEPLVCLPEPDLADVKENKLNVWQNIQKRVQGFWNSWHADYLSTLTQRTKWNKEGPRFNINDVVLLKENNVPPTKWVMGRIIAVYPGKDGIIRVVKLKTQHNELIRPVVKLIQLPVSNNQG